MDNDLNMGRLPGDNPPQNYALSGKIMLSAIIILFAVVIFMVILHVYARWYLLRARRRYLNRRRSRRQRGTHIVFYVDPDNPNSTSVTVPSGLDASVLSTLPVFVYTSKTHPEGLECAVCLSEFEDNEKGRLLPKCQHSFHTECIDMWFHSHSSCPICRSLVEAGVPVQVNENNSQSNVVLSVGEPAQNEPASSSGFCSACLHEEEQMGSSSLAGRRKDLDFVGVRIEVPRRNESEDELRLGSPSSHGFRSPGTRLLSLKRILSLNRKTTAVSPSSGIGTSCGGTSGCTEFDIESGGRDESTQRLSRAPTPR